MPRNKNGRRGAENYGALNPMASNQAQNRQETIERMYLRVLGELCMNRFEWKGFPESVNTRWLEMSLYRKALSVIFVETEITGKMFAVQGSGVGPKNLVDDYMKFMVVGPAFGSKTLSVRNCEPIWANYFRMPDIDIVRIYAWKLAHVDRTIEINSSNARQSRVVAVNENARMSGAALNTAVDNGDNVIEVTTNFGIAETITVMDMSIDHALLDSLSSLRSKLWNECMGLLGINNSNQEKKERLVESEVGANDDQVNTVRRVNLNARQDAAKAITKKFADFLEGAEISVDYYTDIKGTELPPVGGGIPNGELYDSSMES